MTGQRMRMCGIWAIAALLFGCASTSTSPHGTPSTADDGPFGAISGFVAELNASTLALLNGVAPNEAFSQWPHLIPADRLAEIRGAWTRAKGKRLVMSEFEISVQFCSKGNPTARFSMDLSRFSKLAVRQIATSNEPPSSTVCEGKTNFWSSRAYESAAPTGRWDALARLTRKLGDALSDKARCNMLPTVDQAKVKALAPSVANSDTLGQVLRAQLQSACASPAKGEAVYVRFDDVKWLALGDAGIAVGEVKTELNYSDAGLEFELLRWSDSP